MIFPEKVILMSNKHEETTSSTWHLDDPWWSMIHGLNRPSLVFSGENGACEVRESGGGAWHKHLLFWWICHENISKKKTTSDSPGGFWYFWGHFFEKLDMENGAIPENDRLKFSGILCVVITTYWTRSQVGSNGYVWNGFMGKIMIFQPVLG